MVSATKKLNQRSDLKRLVAGLSRLSKIREQQLPVERSMARPFQSPMEMQGHGFSIPHSTIHLKAQALRKA